MFGKSRTNQYFVLRSIKKAETTDLKRTTMKQTKWQKFAKAQNLKQGRNRIWTDRLPIVLASRDLQSRHVQDWYNWHHIQEMSHSDHHQPVSGVELRHEKLRNGFIVTKLKNLDPHSCPYFQTSVTHVYDRWNSLYTKNNSVNYDVPLGQKTE